jgi:hypothetical protein
MRIYTQGLSLWGVAELIDNSVYLSTKASLGRLLIKKDGQGVYLKVN